ncbi:MAG TPA: efflux RND transporter periplasmic adaptor subunit [Geminicoccus sp.]|jgi:macrolide-specific efflux system membrane fusion protein|uniref:efflux RND transporter periplasmic adaptor subunit n=1 Tax=Geminicoccus sp. TaxID=2024832 RepID=UPI002E2FFE1E|nr:efflux RND transporter periplasmic adaptor subunit [Geminicoccus sp.]HEX2529516.1 efflux RND transporter periplasmic adaptor subunit [Geminicoccus sp.]
MNELAPPSTETGASARMRPARRRRRNRWVLALACLVLLAVAAVAYTWWPSDDGEAVAVRTVEVVRGDVADVVSALGTLQPASYVDVGAQVSGQLTRLNAAIGDQVTQGQLLAELDARVLQSRLSTDTAELARLNGVLAQQVAQRELAEAQANRQRAMFRGNATSRDQLDIAEAQLRVLDAQILQTEAEISGQEATIAADRANLSFTRIAAPMTGTVISVTAVQGQTLNANQSAPILLRIADLATMTVEVQVSEADQPKLRLGMPVRFNTLGRPDEPRNGTLRQIYPTPEVVNNVTLYTALFDVANADGELLPQMSVQAFFIRAEAKDVPMVPLAALSRDDGTAERTVQVLDAEGNVSSRQIRIGVSDRVHTEVVSGLEPGERVVLKGVTAPQDAARPRPAMGPRL